MPCFNPSFKEQHRSFPGGFNIEIYLHQSEDLDPRIQQLDIDRNGIDVKKINLKKLNVFNFFIYINIFKLQNIIIVPFPGP